MALWHPDASRIATRPVSSVVLILAQRHRRGESSTIARCPRRPKLRGACLWLGINACTKFQLVPRRRDRMSDERKCTSHRQGFSASVLNMQYPSTQRQQKGRMLSSRRRRRKEKEAATEQQHTPNTPTCWNFQHVRKAATKTQQKKTLKSKKYVTCF